MFISWFLCVFYSMTFVLRNTDPTQREGICSYADIKKKQLKFLLNFALFCYNYLCTYSLCVLVAGQALFADISKFILGEQRDQ